MAIVFIQVNKIVEKEGTVNVHSEFIRADKIETFRSFKKNPSHVYSQIDGDIIKITMKSLSNTKGNKTAKGVYEIYVNESEQEFSMRMGGNGIKVIANANS